MAPAPRNEEKKAMLVSVWFLGDCLVLFDSPAVTKVTGGIVCWLCFLKGNVMGCVSVCLLPGH